MALPRGFAGPMVGRDDLLSRSGSTLRLPAEAEPDGDRVRLPRRSFDAIVIEGMAAVLGDPTAVVGAAGERLLPGGGLVFDVENAQAPHVLRRLLSGGRGGLEPLGSMRSLELPLLLADALDACEAAGLSVGDVVAVPGRPDALAQEFSRVVLAHGIHAPAWLGGVPPARYWVLARRVATLAGSVLIAPGAAGDRTEAALRRFLPADWEIVRCPGSSEPAAWNRGVPLSSGEVLWFLRAGTEPTQAVFDAMRNVAHADPARPEDAADGGPAGMMAPRRDVLLAGPISRQWRNDAVCYEDYGMRLEALGRAPTVVPVALATPEPPPAALEPGCFATEAQEMMTRWQGIAEPAAPPAAPATPRPSPWEGRQPRLSLCMIARDEERFLRGCLERAAPVVDEIVLVDTGSRDATVAIAETFGARVLHRAWDDDFAAPRNEALDAATGDWVLVLDADERLTEGAADGIRPLLHDPAVSGYHLVMRNVYGNGKTQGVRMVRLFRRLPGVRYENRIHEQVTPSLAGAAASLGLSLSTCDVVIEHEGYRDEVVRSRHKDERNERLFRRHLAERPNDVYMLYKFGDFLRRIPGRSDDALTALQRALDLVLQSAPVEQTALPYAGEIAALCALEHARRDRMTTAEAIVERALRSFTPTPNLHYIAAGLALRGGRDDEAIAHYRRCLQYRDAVLVVPIQEGVTSWVSHCGIAQALWNKGHRAAARRRLEHVRRLAPFYDVAVLALARMHLEDGRPGEALSELSAFLAEHPDSAGACQQAALILGHSGWTEPARRMGERAIELLERACLEEEARRMRETMASLAATAG